MRRKIKQLSEKVTLQAVPQTVQTLLKDEAIGGKLILVAAMLALVVANSPWSQVYEDFWHQVVTIGFGSFVISLDLQHWVSEGLMTLFFLVVGLEVKREFVYGELRHFKTAVLPIAAAIGGMIIPALFFFAFNQGDAYSLQGWAIPIATDIAIALAIISLLGDKVPSSLKLFLLTLAIVDDIGAIVVIAAFYGAGLSWPPFVVACAVAVFLWMARNWKVMSIGLFTVLGILLWIATYKSGVHPSIAGALLGFLAPLAPKSGSVAERLERAVIPLSTFVVVPLFAFASFGIALSLGGITEGPLSVFWGIIAGLVFGKVIGITATCWVLVKVGAASLPSGSNWSQLLGVGFVAGIGFTVSVFVAELAYAGSASYITTAKLAIIIASTISALGGYMLLRRNNQTENSQRAPIQG